MQSIWTLCQPYPQLTNSNNNGSEHESGQQHLTICFSFTQQTCGNNQQESIPRTWVLLGNQSMVDVFWNKELLEDIYEADTTLDIHCNAGVSSTNKMGILRGYRRVWYHPSGIAIVLSLRWVQECYQVTFDSEVENWFLVTKCNGTTFEFQQSNGGLYYLDAADTKEKCIPWQTCSS